MSDEPRESDGKRLGRAVLVLAPIGAAIGFYCFCPPGHDCGVLALIVGVPTGLVAGLIAYAAVRAVFRNR